MFTRPEESYDVKEQVIEGILKDKANPLNQILNLIPVNAKVLDIGAGNGLLAMLFFKKKKAIFIDGIEPNKYAAMKAKPYYRNFFNGYLSSFFEILKNENYDYIILADVIEHVVDPIKFISEIKMIMNEQTKLIFSIPNVAFGSIRINLLFGMFQYTDSGIIEKTHLRFYNEFTIKNLMSSVKLNINQILYLHRSIFNTECSPYLHKVPFWTLCEILSDNNANVYQFLIIAEVEDINRKHYSTTYIHVQKNMNNCFSRVLNYKCYYLYKQIKQTIKKVFNEIKS